jgi:hypothetical protein
MMNPTQKSDSRVFSRRIPVRLVFVAACLLTLIAIFYTEENWRGKRAWENCRKQLEAKGVDLNWKSHIPPPIPDDQNIFKAPKIAEWFVKPRQAGASNELVWKCSGMADCVGRQSSNVVAEVRVVGLHADVPAERADVILQCTQERSPWAWAAFISADPVQSENLRQAVHKRLWPAAIASNGPSLKGAQGYYTFLAKPPGAPAPIVRVTLRTEHPDRILDPNQVAAMFPRNLFATVFPGGSDLRVEPNGTNVCDVFLRNPGVCSAADYLACTDRLEPEFEQIRSALKRPYARREGDYEHTWEVPIPNFVAVRTVAQTLAQRAQCDLLLGNPAAALRELTLLHDVSRLVGGKPMTLVAAMINVAVTGLYTSVIAEGLQLHAWREPQLVALQQQLEGVRLLGPLVEAMDTERVSACHIFETTKPADLENIFAFGRDNPSFWWKIRDPSFWALRCMPRGWLYQNMAALAQREQSFIEAIDPSRDLIATRKVDEVGNESIAWVSRRSPYAILARVAMPNYLKACRTVARNQTMVNQALVACGLERYRLAHNKYPEALAELEPDFVHKLPHEVIIINDQPFKYRRLAGDKFLLYSVGWNGVDDGGTRGKTVPEADWVWEGS